MHSVEPLNFYSLHKFLDHLPEDQIIYIWQRQTVNGLKRSEITIIKEELTEDKRGSTLEFFLEIIKNHAPVKTISQLEELKLQHASLTVGDARLFYKECIIEELDFLHLLVARSPLDKQKRIVWTNKFPLLNPISDKENISTENSQTIEKFKHYLTAIYGLDKLQKTCQIYEIDLQDLQEKGMPLTVDLVHELTIGLSDIFFEDIESFYSHILEVLTFYKDQNISKALLHLAKLPERHLEGLQRQLDIQMEEGLKGAIEFLDKLVEVFSSYESLQTLSKEAFNILVDALRPPKNHQDIPFSGHKIEGVINSQKPRLEHVFIYCRWYEDQERLQLYNEILQLQQQLPQDQVQIAYDELFAKCLVKKEMQEGSLVPAPLEDGSIGWYVVEKRVIEEGKFFYFLKEAISDYNLPDRIEYRSTSSDPATLDSLNTVIADLEPLDAPGYMCKDHAKEIELQILLCDTDKPLKINGHSLGGTIAEICIINLIEHLMSHPDDKIFRPIYLSYFDAPAISKLDALEFAQWVLENPESSSNISIKAFISKNDFVAGAGGLHLGYAVKKEKLKKLEFFLLSPTPSGRLSKPELDLHPHTQLFYVNEINEDFIEEKVSVEEYDIEPWRQNLETLRHVAGSYVTPVLKLGGYVKSFFFGSRLYESGISQLAKSLFYKS